MSESTLWSRIVYIMVFGSCFYYLIYELRFRTSRLLAMMVLLAALYILYVPTDSTLMNSLSRYAMFVTLYTLWSGIFLKIERSYALYLAVFYTVFMGVWLSCVQMIFSALGGSSLPVMTAILGTCRVIAIVPVKKLFVRIDGMRCLTFHEIMISLFPAAACFIANLVLFDYLRSDKLTMTNGYRSLIQILVLFFGFSAILVLFSSERYFEMSHQRDETERARQQLYAQYQIFLREQENNEKIRAIHHDMRHHLQTLEAMSGSGEMQEYISELKQSIRDVELPFHTGSRILDTLLTLKKEECDWSGIEMTCFVRLNHPEILTPMEICTLFGNCISNAIEAVSDPQVQQPYIHLSGGERNGNLVVRIENPYAHELRPGLETTKPQSELHGYGLLNIRRVIEQKGGTLAIRTEDGRFNVTWMIPLQ